MDKGHNAKMAWGALPPLPTAPARPHLTLPEKATLPACPLLQSAVTTLTTGPLYMQFFLSPQIPACPSPFSSSVTPMEESFELYLWNGPGSLVKPVREPHNLLSGDLLSAFA
ncbi:unnamed protein product [Rangifer tarandus platyrhynchus]|uniref:Uncharacterized protein n=2 Tax=Rangifer tarandus platyrhynchus TaxID=3082113 RepID=A0ABN8Z2B3_RANTA|nr:unnamed protein product [Rangifer tarandus platyrhynchus]